MVYRTPEEMVDLIVKEHLLQDASMTILDGRNRYGFKAVEVPASSIDKAGDIWHVTVYEKDGTPVKTDVSVYNDGKSVSLWLVKTGEGAYDVMALRHDKEDAESIETKRKEYLAMLAVFFDRFGLNTRGKMLAVLREGFQRLKEETGLQTDCEFLRDFLANETIVRQGQIPDKYGVRFRFHFPEN